MALAGTELAALHLAGPHLAGTVPLDRDGVLHAVVGGGGMLLLAYAAWAHAHARASVAQLRALVAAGLGFLLSTYASVALRDRGVAGMSVSLLGSMLVLWGALTLVRERQHERERGARAPWPPDDRPPNG